MREKAVRRAPKETPDQGAGRMSGVGGMSEGHGERQADRRRPEVSEGTGVNDERMERE